MLQYTMRGPMPQGGAPEKGAGDAACVPLRLLANCRGLGQTPGRSIVAEGAASALRDD